jgi:hypothetical protein
MTGLLSAATDVANANQQMLKSFIEATNIADKAMIEQAQMLKELNNAQTQIQQSAAQYMSQLSEEERKAHDANRAAADNDFTQNIIEPLSNGDKAGFQAAIERANKVMDAKIKEAADLGQSLTADSPPKTIQDKRDMDFRILAGFDMQRIAIRYANQDPIQQAEQLNTLENKAAKFAVEASHLQPSVDILARYAADKTNVMGEEKIQKFQDLMAKELESRTPDNKNNPISPNEYDRRVQLLSDMKDRIDQLPDGAAKQAMLEKNEDLRSELGTKMERCNAYMDTNSNRDDLDLIAQIHEKMDDPDNKDFSSDEPEAKEALLKTMEERLEKMEKSLNKAIEKAMENPKSNKEQLEKLNGRLDKVTGVKDKNSEKQHEHEKSQRNTQQPTTPRPPNPPPSN